MCYVKNHKIKIKVIRGITYRVFWHVQRARQLLPPKFHYNRSSFSSHLLNLSRFWLKKTLFFAHIYCNKLRNHFDNTIFHSQVNIPETNVTVVSPHGNLSSYLSVSDSKRSQIDNEDQCSVFQWIGVPFSSRP